VPAELQGSEVVVAGIGPLPVPEPQTILKNAARRFVGEQTRAVMPALASVLTTALQPNLVGVETATTKRSVIVRVNGHQVATANRFRITITGSGHLDDPLHNPEAAPRLRAAVDRARVDAKRARDDRVRANVQIVRSQAVSKPKRVKTAAVPRAVPEKADLRFALPTTLPATARERATRASQRLRSERTLVPAVWLEVTTGHGTLRFEPISEAENPLEARFTFAGGGARFSGALRLKRPDDPLTLRVDNGSAEHLTGQAWAAALIVYSHLTCVGLPDAQTREPQAARCPPQLAPRAVGATPTSRRSRPLRMDAGTARERQSIDAVIRDAVEQTRAVSGHLRRLAVGARASPEAIRAGERAGIRVPPGHTWVRPHGWWADEVVGVRWPHEARLW
jgi:hypothetical protein